MWYDDILLSVTEIESILEVPMISVISYDREMERSIALGSSVMELNPSSPISNEIMQLAADLVGKLTNQSNLIKKELLSVLRSLLHIT